MLLDAIGLDQNVCVMIGIRWYVMRKSRAVSIVFTTHDYDCFVY